MIVGVARLELYMPANTSLKDKRRVLTSLMERTRRRFNVAIAELEANDSWEHAVLGVCCIANARRHVEQLLDHVIRWIDAETGGQLVRYQAEFL
ncbi:MAG TPA: DUF503 domain-containing protein [Bacillota bacterium]